MRKIIRKFYYLLSLVFLLTTLAALSACGPKATTTATAAPAIVITSPTGGVTPQIGDVTVSVTVSNFNIVDKMGQAKVAGQGHIHYFVDVDAPTTPGQPAVTAAGTYATTTATSYTWHNIGGGPHKFSVELVNNDHTPLSPPRVATVSVNVIPEIGPSSLAILSPRDGASVPSGNVTVDIQVSNFNIVDKQGQANVSHDGHVHYYLDVEAPTTPGQPAIPASGIWAHVAASTYTFTNVAAGTHTISVELVNNDHTPLEPPVVARITINVQSASTPTPTTTASPTPTTTPTGVTIDLVAQNMAFNKSTITVPAGASVTMNFDNKDSVPHNFALYTNSSAATMIFRGQTITNDTIVYTFTALSTPGTYFFRCDVHPTTMTGTFVVE